LLDQSPLFEFAGQAGFLLRDRFSAPLVLPEVGGGGEALDFVETRG